MTVPRSISLRKTAEGYRLTQRPVQELEHLRGGIQTVRQLSLGEEPVPLSVEGGAIDLQANLSLGQSEQVAITLTDAEGYQMVVGVNPRVNEVFIDRSRSGPHFHDGFANRHVAPVDLSKGSVSLRLLVDESIVELFINDGEQTITDRFFRGSGALRWSASARGAPAIMDITAWPIRPEASR
jgi:fructan beta-fructosidase